MKNNMMKKFLTMTLACAMTLSLAACGAKGDSKTENSGDTAQTEEAAATHMSLMDRDNEILSENTELWEKVFLGADKGMTMQEDGKNYGDLGRKPVPLTVNSHHRYSRCKYCS